MEPFNYVRPTDIQGAIAAARGHANAAYIAGGTNLVDLMKLHVARPGLLIDVNHLPLRQVEARSGGLVVGALVRNSDLAHHATVRRDYPLLADALLAGASPQLRNMATVGGNLLQRTRCSYFNDPTYACNKRVQGSGCPALEGAHRMHAVLGTSSQCIAAHPSDMCVALAALDAQVLVNGPNGERRIPFQSFHREPGETPAKDTVLEAGDLVVGLELPPPIGGQRSHYLKIRDRASYAFALVSAAALLVVDGGRIRTARLALGGVGTRPWRATAAEQVLTGAIPTAEIFAQAADAALQGATPRRDNAFKVDLAKRAVQQAFAYASGLERG